MLIRTALVFLAMTVCAVAFHEHTFAVFELRELLLERTLNLWELMEQLEYVTQAQREVVYSDIAQIQAEINRIIEELILLDKQQH
tara:strand:- start:3097 stop:3351 length:255 start_codon:yes stop_codon:yes gene_type:complete